MVINTQPVMPKVQYYFNQIAKSLYSHLPRIVSSCYKKLSLNKLKGKVAILYFKI